jgi:hypothetical protein
MLKIEGRGNLHKIPVLAPALAWTDGSDPNASFTHPEIHSLNEKAASIGKRLRNEFLIRYQYAVF